MLASAHRNALWHPTRSPFSSLPCGPLRGKGVWEGRTLWGPVGSCHARGPRRRVPGGRLGPQTCRHGAPVRATPRGVEMNPEKPDPEGVHHGHAFAGPNPMRSGRAARPWCA